jgi:5'-nucleotidase
VSATFEGTLLGIPSVAFSQEIAEGYSFERAAAFAGRFVAELLTGDPAPGSAAERQSAAGELQGLSFTRLGKRVYKQVVVEKEDPAGAQVLLDRRHAGVAVGQRHRPRSGRERSRVSVTPLHLDLTDYRGLEGHAELRGRLGRIVSPDAEDVR